MSKNKFVNKEEYDNLSDSINLSIDFLKQINSNYYDIKKLFENFDSEKKLEKYIEYLEKKEKYCENNVLIDSLKDICKAYEVSKWMKPMLKKLESVESETIEDDYSTGFTRSRSNVKIYLSFNKFTIELNYEYDRDYCIGKSELDIDIEGMMEYFELPKDKIKAFNIIMLEWIVGCNTNGLRYSIDQLQDYIDKYEK